MPDFAVSTSFSARDKVTAAFKSMWKSAGKFGDTSSSAFRKASKAGSRFGDIVKGIFAADLLKRGITTLTNGVRVVTQEFIAFDSAVTNASAKFKGLNLATEEGQAKLEALKKTARDVGSVTQFSASQAAEGLDFLAMAGFNADQAMSALPGVVDLATVANIDLARSTDIASDSLGAFGLMTENTVQLEKNFQRQNDVMAKTMSSTNTSIEDMFEAVKKGAPTFTSAGQSMESFNALLGVMANSGVKGSEAGTQLRNVMLRLAKPTGEAQDTLKKLGVQTSDSQGNFRDVVDILKDFEKGLKGMGTQQKAAALSTIFGTRAVTGINLLLQEGTKSISKFRDGLINAEGAAGMMANTIRQSLQNRLASLKSAALEVGFKFAEAFQETAGTAIDSLTEKIRQFDPTPIINAIISVAKFTSKLFKALKPLAPLLPIIVAGMIAYNIALKAQVAIQAISHFFKFVKVLMMAAKAQGVLNLMMSANPIGAIITGIVILIALIILIVKNFKKIKAAVIGFFDSKIGKIVKIYFALMFFQIFLAIVIIKTLVKVFKAAFIAIPNFFKNTKLGQFIVKVFKPILQIPKLIKLAWGGLVEYFKNLWLGIKIIVEKISIAFKKVANLFRKKDNKIDISGDASSEPGKRQAPNRAEVAARKQQIQFNGQLNIAGAPAGSNMTSETRGAKPIKTELLGQNP